MALEYKIKTLSENAITFDFAKNKNKKNFSDQDLEKKLFFLALDIRRLVNQENCNTKLSKSDLDLLLKLKTTCQALGITDCLNSFTTITVFFQPETTSHEMIINLFELIAQRKSDHKISSKSYLFPACYQEIDNSDLDEISQTLKLDKKEIIKLHSEQTYSVCLIGFTPGFPFCKKVDKRLALNRKKTPRIRMTKGDVAIVQDKTVIYPHTSPGGWNIVARTPIPIFEIKNNKPSCLSFGDKIKFEPISLTEFNKYKKSNLGLSKFLVSS